MKTTKEKMKKVVELIEKREDSKAKEELRKIIKNHQKMKEYKKRLAGIGLDLKKIDVPDKIFEQIEDILKDYERPAQLIILDAMYYRVAK